MTTNYTIQFIRGKLALDHTTNLSLVHLSTILQMKNRYERMIIVYLNSYEHMTYSSRHTAGGGSGGNRPGQQLVNRPQQHRNQILDISEFEKKKKTVKLPKRIGRPDIYFECYIGKEKEMFITMTIVV